MQESYIILNFNYIGRFYFSKKAQKLVLRFFWCRQILKSDAQGFSKPW
ncbi:hypothetical protein FHS57_002131 [Runella defluvii]|uniref:Uncharacterized protein n=1 Tax=Runella defluvii TaxID=370973 RepID=A0A7W6EQ80_9BACT|nr:hypothetical protein [Runella defluvii]